MNFFIQPSYVEFLFFETRVPGFSIGMNENDFRISLKRINAISVNFKSFLKETHSLKEVELI